jgi:hypothetical protein
MGIIQAQSARHSDGTPTWGDLVPRDPGSIGDSHHLVTKLRRLELPPAVTRTTGDLEPQPSAENQDRWMLRVPYPVGWPSL